MPQRFALLITPATDPRDDYRDTFTVVDQAQLTLDVADRALQRGDGIFETMGVKNGHVQEVEAHLARLENSARICDLPAPIPEQWTQAIAIAAAACGAGEWAIRLSLSRGSDAPSAWLTASPAADFTGVRGGGVRVVTLDRGFRSDAADSAPWLLLGAKTLSYGTNLAALREAKRRGADDAVFVTSDGFLLEAPTASLILRQGDRFVTPAPGAGILHGTTQISVFEFLGASRTSYETLPVSALREADAAWLVSSMRLAAPITAVDGSALPTDAETTELINQYLLSPRT